jgi:hypothetical protein
MEHDKTHARKHSVRPLTPDLWPAIEDLFGDNGACNGSWCMYWRTGTAYYKRPRAENREAFQQVLKQGPPPGLLAFDGDLAVGWCQRSDLETGRASPRSLSSRWSTQRSSVGAKASRMGVASAFGFGVVKSPPAASDQRDIHVLDRLHDQLAQLSLPDGLRDRPVHLLVATAAAA